MSTNTKEMAVEASSIAPRWQAADTKFVLVDGWPDSAVRRNWGQLIENSENALAFFQSPQWFEYQHEELGESLGIISVRREPEELVAMVPFLRKPYVMNFNIRKRILGKSSLRALEFPGGEPLAGHSAALYDGLLETLLQVQPSCNCFAFNRVSIDGYFWNYLRSSPLVAVRFLVYVPEDTRTISHSIILPETFEQYLAHFPPKFRRELGRQVRRLRDRGRGVLELRRYESPQESGEFLAAATHVAGGSWQHAHGSDVLEDSAHWRAKLASLADHGALRAYLLWCGETPCAVELGYQMHDVFHGIMTYFDPAFRDFSPGSALLYLFIEDLIGHKPPRRLNFGGGDFEYKRRFGNASIQEATVLLLRKTVANRLRRGSHALFRSCVASVRRRVQRGARTPLPGGRSQLNPN